MSVNEIFVPREFRIVMASSIEIMKALEYMMQVMEERVRVEEQYGVGLSKVQGMLNFVKEQASGSFECSALRVDVGHRVFHTSALVQQMKQEIEEIKVFLKSRIEQQKLCDNLCKESERSFKASIYDLDKQKKDLSSAYRELEDACSAFSLISNDPAKNQAKWKDRMEAALSRMRCGETSKANIEAQYKVDIHHTDVKVAEFNEELKIQHAELVVMINSMQEQIFDIARKQLVFEVNQIRNLQYDLDCVIKQVELKHIPPFSSELSQLTNRNKFHRPITFNSFLSSQTDAVLKATRVLEKESEKQQLVEEEEGQIKNETKKQGKSYNGGLEILFDGGINKADHLAAQQYFERSILREEKASIYADIIENECVRNSAVYLVNSVIDGKGDCADIEVDILDISLLLNQINKQKTTTQDAQINNKSSQSEIEYPQINYLNKVPKCVFLIFLESFRSSGQNQVSLRQYNQLVCECFRYLDAVLEDKCEAQVRYFMPLSFAVFRLSAIEKVFIYERVRHHTLWSSNDLWEALIISTVQGDLAKLPEEMSQEESLYRATVHSNLAAIGINMLKFRQTKSAAKNTIGKLAQAFGMIPNGITELLSFIENEGDKEKPLSFVINKHSQMSTVVPNISKGRVIRFASTIQTIQTMPSTPNQSEQSKLTQLSILPQSTKQTQPVTSLYDSIALTQPKKQSISQIVPQNSELTGLSQIERSSQATSAISNSSPNANHDQKPQASSFQIQTSQSQAFQPSIIMKPRTQSQIMVNLPKQKVRANFFGLQGSADFALNKPINNKLYQQTNKHL